MTGAELTMDERIERLEALAKTGNETASRVAEKLKAARDLQRAARTAAKEKRS